MFTMLYKRQLAGVHFSQSPGRAIYQMSGVVCDCLRHRKLIILKLNLKMSGQNRIIIMESLSRLVIHADGSENDTAKTDIMMMLLWNQL